MKMLIKPLETFLFRNAKPFDIEDNLAESIFPPYPSTFYGAIRTAAIAQNNQYNSFLKEEKNEINNQIGSKDNLGSFSIRNLNLVFYNDKNIDLFIVPRDLVMKKNDIPNDYKKYPLYSLQKLEKVNYLTQSLCNGLKLYKTKEDKMSYSEDSWFTNMKDYLLGNNQKLTYLKKSQIFEIEEKIGISIDLKKGTSKDKMLFNQRRLRMKGNISLSINFSGLTNIHKQGILAIGQDRRLFSYSIINAEEPFSKDFIENLKTKVKENKLFKLIFTTPVIFKNGWLPENVENYVWNLDGLKIKIISIFAGRSIGIGGWDIQKKRPKPIRRAIPAGSVFYCKLETGEVEMLFEKLFNKNIGYDKNLCKQGFGHSLIGNLK